MIEEQSRVPLSTFIRQGGGRSALHVYWVDSRAVVRQRVWYANCWDEPINIFVCRSAADRLHILGAQDGINDRNESLACHLNCTLQEVRTILH